MLVAILILTIFNLITIWLVGVGCLGACKGYIEQAKKEIINNTDEDMASIGTAIFNADSIKQKVQMGGEVEL